ncbi:MAG TPA: hypothetical protein VGN72_04475 [Tepidisphaeraceae bacterium]|jgi:hypothetical protein|nr:hypothetical protein [Tepidisphaeraceae bacterium]
MVLAQTEAAPIYTIITTDGITIAIVAFLFACFVFPSTIKNRPQFYAAFYLTLGIVLLTTLRLMMYQAVGLYVVFGVLTGLAQVGAILLLFMSAGGMSLGQLSDELKGTYEVIRRGETEKEVIVPIGRDKARNRDVDDDDDDDTGRTVHVINTPTPPPSRPDRSGPVPLE